MQLLPLPLVTNQHGNEIICDRLEFQDTLVALSSDFEGLDIFYNLSGSA